MNQNDRIALYGAILLLVIILLFVIWYTSNIKIEKEEVKTDYTAYSIDEGYQIILAGVDEYKAAMAVYEGKYHRVKYRIEKWYELYFPNSGAASLDTMLNALEQRLSMADCFKKGDNNE